jgi:hypothetical protein
LLIYLAPWIGAFAAWKFRIDKIPWPMLPLSLALSTAGVVEFAMSILTDALDTARHLFMFQVITELLILMIAAALLNLLSRTAPAHREAASALRLARV